MLYNDNTILFHKLLKKISIARTTTTQDRRTGRYSNLLLDDSVSLTNTKLSVAILNGIFKKAKCPSECYICDLLSGSSKRN